MKKHTAKEAVKIIIATAKDYNRLLENKNFIFIYRNRLNNQIEYFETVFLPRHFQHLCGVDYINSDNGKVIHNSTDFYNRALNNELSHKEIFKEADDTNCEGKWKGNHSFVNDIRNKTTHRNSPDVVAISDYDINLTHPHIFLIIGKQFFPFGKFGNKSVCCFSF